jgi:hypothetical protein
MGVQGAKPINIDLTKSPKNPQDYEVCAQSDPGCNGGYGGGYTCGECNKIPMIDPGPERDNGRRHDITIRYHQLNHNRVTTS